MNPTFDTCKHFQVDGLLVAVRCLCLQYQLDYKTVGDSEPYTEYIIVDKPRNGSTVGKAFINDQGIVIKFSKSVRYLLMSKGYPVLHPEEDVVEEFGMTDLFYLANTLVWVVGNYDVTIDDNSQTLIIHREGASNA
jgi:hypothetical protein